MTTAIHDGVPQRVYKHRCEICYQQSDCFIDGAIPKHTVKIILPWCNEVAVVRHRGEQCYPCPDCERAAVSSGNAYLAGPSWQTLSWPSSMQKDRQRDRQRQADKPAERETHAQQGPFWSFAFSAITGRIIDRNEEIRINSWENISSRLHTRLRQHYARHHHCFLNQVYKTPEEVIFSSDCPLVVLKFQLYVRKLWFLNSFHSFLQQVKEFYITARKIRCQMIHGPSPRIDSSL